MRSPTAAQRCVFRIVALAAILVLSAPTAAAQESGSPEPAQDPGALDALTACVQETGHLSVLLLIDESGSLRQTDPENDRVVAAQSIIDTLAQLPELASSSEQSITVEVLIAGFAQEYYPHTGWTNLAGEGLSVAREEAARFANRNTGLDTDFANALIGANTDLSARRDQLDAKRQPSCATVMFFTDGEYDIEPRGSAETKGYAPTLPLNDPRNATNAEVVGIGVLCNENGVVDQLRASQIPMITVALTGAIDAAGLALIEAITTGKAGETVCGRPSGTAGAFLPAADIDAVLTAFSSVASQISGGSVDTGAADDELAVCATEPCEKGTIDITIDPGVRRVNALITSERPNIDLHITPPGEKTIVLSRGGRSTAGSTDFTTEGSWLSDTAVSLDIEPKSEAAHGAWSIVLIDRAASETGGPASVQIARYGDLFPTLLGDLTRAGDGAIVVRAGVVDGEGAAPDELPQGVSMRAELVDTKSGAKTPVALTRDGDRFRGSGAVPEGFGPKFDLIVMLDVTTELGTRLPTKSIASKHRLPNLATVEATTVPTSTVPDEIGMAAEAPAEKIETDDGSGGGSLLKILALVVVAGAAIAGLGWAALRSFFDVSKTSVAKVPILVHNNGQIERLAPFRGEMRIDQEDLTPLELGSRSRRRSFSTHGLRFSVFLSRNPFREGEGRAKGEGRLTGSIGREIEGESSIARIGFDLRQEWVFALDEETSLLVQQGATRGDVYGTLYLFVSPAHLVNPPESFRDSLNNDLPKRARQLLVDARPNISVDADGSDMIDFLERISPD